MANIHLVNNELAKVFQYHIQYLQYSHFSNPAFSDALVSQINIIANIAYAMNELAELNRSSPVHLSLTIILKMAEHQ